MTQAGRLPQSRGVDVYFASMGDAARGRALQLCEHLRGVLPDVNVQTHTGPGSLKSQLRQADRLASRIAVLLGDEELAQGLVTVKPMRPTGSERRLAETELPSAVAELLTPLHPDAGADAVPELSFGHG
jgi:histidyl-tRNA synthetase